MELKNKITKSSLNDKYHNVNILLNDLYIKSKSQNNKFECLLEDQKYIDNKIKAVKYKLSKINPGTILEIKKIKKVYKHKNEKKNNIKMIEEQFNEYCKKRISWSRSVIGTEYNDEKIINLLDLFDKLNKNYKSDNSSDDELSSIFNDLKENKFKEYNIICNLGKYFINNNIEDKSQIQDIIKNYKKELKHYDANKESKQNRFISTCKRLYLLSQKINVNNIVKSNCITSIRDISNNDFDILLKLLEKL